MKTTIFAAALCAFGLAAPAQALFLSQESLFFGTGSELGATDVSGLEFSYVAEFDPAADLFSATGLGAFAASFTLDIDTVGLVEIPLSSGAAVAFSDQDPDIVVLFTDVGLASGISTGFRGIGSFDVDAPTPASFVNAFSVSTGSLDFETSAGLLKMVATGPVVEDAAATITDAAVPLPGALGLLGAAVGGLGVVASRRRRAA